MADEVLADWTSTQASALGREVLLARHQLADWDLFSDAGLIRTFEAHPRETFQVWWMGRDKIEREWQQGDPGDLSGDQLLQAVRQGRLWFNILRVQDHHPAYRDLLNQIYDELEARCPGFRTLYRSMNLLVSAADAMVFYHADSPLNMLWHLRGRKRVWVYPPGDPRFAPQEELERIYAQEVQEDLPYREEFDQHAEVFDLEPGDIVTWPQNTPHRIENLSGLNVSLSTEHYTPEARRRQNVYLANLYFRRRFGLPFRSTAIHGAWPFMKTNAFRVARKARLLPIRPIAPPMTFRVDPSAPGAMVALPSGERPRRSSQSGSQGSTDRSATSDR